MDRVRQLIIEKAKEKGTSLKVLSEQAGKNHAYLQQFVKRGQPADLPEKIRRKLADLLGVDEDSLRPVEGEAGGNGNVIPNPRTQNARLGGAVALTATLPVYGQAVSGRDGKFVLNGNKIADIIAPPTLAGVPDAYAVYIVGESMEPRYFAGEAVFVNPRAPVRRGDFVVAQIHDSEDRPSPDAYVKRFVSMDDRLLRLEQYNPRKTMEFPRKKVASVHRIVMGGDG